MHEEKLPGLRANEQQYHVSEEKKEEVLTQFRSMRAEGKEVRRVGAVQLLTAKQVRLQPHPTPV